MFLPLVSGLLCVTALCSAGLPPLYQVRVVVPGGVVERVVQVEVEGNTTAHGGLTGLYWLLLLPRHASAPVWLRPAAPPTRPAAFLFRRSGDWVVSYESVGQGELASRLKYSAPGLLQLGPTPRPRPRPWLHLTQTRDWRYSPNIQVQKSYS